ncbi:MAG: hypothetical protein JWO82_4172 [Akkermansiaceae bacterium]|nr:hypothetical protein [Akkermansiaceae bacterium]
MMADQEERDSATEFADLAVRLLERFPDRHTRARNDLLSRIYDAGPQHGAALAAGLARLKAAAVLSRKSRFLWIVATVVVAGAIVCGLFDLVVERNMSPRRGGIELPFSEQLAERRTENLKVSPPPFSGKGTKVDDMARLSLEHPDDPVWYQARVRLRIEALLGLPDDYDTHWREIDPGNGIWLELKAQELATRVRISRVGMAEKIDDPEVVTQMMDALREEVKQPMWKDYSRHLLDHQRAAFRPPLTLAEDDATVPFIWLAELPPMGAVERVVKAAFQEKLASGETAAAIDLLDVWMAAARMRLLQPGNEPPADPITMPFGDFVWIAKKAGLPAQEAQLRQMEKNGGQSGRMSVSAPGWERLPSGMGDETYAPGDTLRDRRMAEYARADRTSALCVAAGSLLLMLILRWQVSRGSFGQLSAGLKPLFTHEDQVKLIVFGVLLPLLWWAILIHFTPAGARQLGIGFPGEDLKRYHAENGAGLLLLVMSLLGILKHQARLRAGFLGAGRREKALDLIAVILSAVALLPLWAISIKVAFLDPALMVSASLLGLPLLWLLWQLGRGMAGLWKSRVAAALILPRFVVPLGVLSVVCLAAAPILKQQEGAWLKNDILNAAGPPENRFCYRETDFIVGWVRSHLK